VAPSRLTRCLRDSGVEPEDFLSFPETVGAYHALFVRDGARDALGDATQAAFSLLKPPPRSVEGASGPLRPLAEVAAVRRRVEPISPRRASRGSHPVTLES